MFPRAFAPPALCEPMHWTNNFHSVRIFRKFPQNLRIHRQKSGRMIRHILHVNLTILVVWDYIKKTNLRMQFMVNEPIRGLAHVE